MLTIVSIMILKLPEYHYEYVRNVVSAKVVKITNFDKTSGGTGFHVRSPSGKTYILTNAHVCSIEKDGEVLVTDENEHSMIRKVIERSDFTDLCLVEGVPGTKGLLLGSEPKIGEIVAVIGHPKLMPTTVSRGEIIGQQEIDVIDHVIESKDDKCDLPKNRKDEMDFFFFRLPVCLIHIQAYLSNVVILPGNSGSPVVNFYGHVVAVAFAGDSQSNWGFFVTLKDVKKFLKKY